MSATRRGDRLGVYDAVFDDAALERVMAQLHGLNPAGVTALYFVERRGGRRTLAWQSGAFPEAAEGLAADTTSADPEQLASAREGEVVSWSVEATASSGASVPDRTSGLARRGLTEVDTAIVHTSARLTLLLSAAQPADGPPADRARLVEELHELTPHLGTVARLRLRRLHELDGEIGPLLDLVHGPAMVCDDELTRVVANARARQYFGAVECDGSGSGLLQGMGDGAVARLVNRLVAAGDIAGRTAFLGSDGDFVVAEVVRQADRDGPVTRAERRAEGIARPSVLIALRIAHRSFAGVNDEALAAFKITPSEQRLLEGLLSGRTMPQIASGYGVSYNTVRNQLASLTQKTGLHGQVEIVRFFASLR
ncbi:helix-turn-helix transcriptional regulator [Acuticoccus sp.]|uniref:helix-turn-helix transcriptional regulator n=1 Tax=Acuticoccus sp. TaxID=1904378 RepID=UPI003B5192C4